MPTQLAIFASGAGSNAQKIIDYFKNNAAVKVALVVCNNPQAGVIPIAEAAGIPVLLITRQRFVKGDAYVAYLKNKAIDHILLAGFLWKVPVALVQAYPKRIINIHPALLPKYGGKGMYGQHVHEAVIAAGEKKSGITIHYVDEQYDHGATIFQACCAVAADDTPDTLATKVHALEHQYFAPIVEKLIAENQEMQR